MICFFKSVNEPGLVDKPEIVDELILANEPGLVDELANELEFVNEPELWLINRFYKTSLDMTT